MEGYEINDRLLLVYRHRDGIDIRAAVVFDLNYRGNGLVTYTGRWDQQYIPSGTGAFKPSFFPLIKYGLIDVINLDCMVVVNRIKITKSEYQGREYNRITFFNPNTGKFEESYLYMDVEIELILNYWKNGDLMGNWAIGTILSENYTVE